jgi:hypothetical protein
MPNLMDLISKAIKPSQEQVDSRAEWEESIRKDPMVLTGDPGTAPGLALIPNPKNLGRFRDLMNKWMEAAPKGLNVEGKQGFAYLHTRYPKLASKVSVVPMEDFNSPGTAAYTRWNGVVVVPEKMKGFPVRKFGANLLVDATDKVTATLKDMGLRKPAKQVATTVTKFLEGSSNPLLNIVHVLAHEGKHSWDMQAGKLTPKTYGKAYNKISGGLKDEVKWLRDWRFNPFEQRAERAGNTAAKGFNKFLNMVP